MIYNAKLKQVYPLKMVDSSVFTIEGGAYVKITSKLHCFKQKHYICRISSINQPCNEEVILFAGPAAVAAIVVF